MSTNWVQDIGNMHAHFGVYDWLDKNENDPEIMKKLLAFRLAFLREELDETAKAVEEMDAEEIVDGLIDLCVVAIGTLDIFNINSYTAWDEILEANMSKEPGVKPNRPNPLGLPDLMKPEGWTGPSHEGNHGTFTETFK